ncbi:hypothetical protein AVEN_257839-1 [Araneus ventricosus]|uniref:DUF19 domain-containing protein n=1 Tax=Araneus ventricosus TaxID=182803 RepID=A0A4Y2EHG2_ARAVE|nr:hypothetical protein AVEN_257839-1 [Araneus ventricosus]
MMNLYLKLLHIYLACNLLALAPYFVTSDDSGDETLNFEELEKCFRTVTCDLGDEAFEVTRKCYDILEEENFKFVVNLVKQSAEKAGMQLVADDLDGLHGEYCAFTEEQKTTMYEYNAEPLMDELGAICCNLKKRKQCKNFKSFLRCGLEFVGDFASEGKCQVNGFNK